MEETIRDIKKELRANMNGIASKRMRDAGMPYHLIWGIELPRLRDIAREFLQHPYIQESTANARRLAQRLWSENVRESQMLGILLMPPSEFTPDLAELWVREARTTEAISLLAMELITPQRWATDIAFHWIASTDTTESLCGWLTLCRLLRQGGMLNERSRLEVLDHASSIPQSAPLQLRKAVQQTIDTLEQK